MRHRTTLLTPHGGRDLAGDTGTNDERYAWVLAAPFRAHVRRLMLTEALPWRVVAGMAGVPDAVVCTLVCGREGRLRSRIAPRDAAALMALDAARVHLDRCLVVPSRDTAYACRTLLWAGRTVPQAAAMLDLTARRTHALLTGEQWSTSLLTQQRAFAALRAHGFDTPHHPTVPSMSGRVTSRAA